MKKKTDNMLRPTDVSRQLGIPYNRLYHAIVAGDVPAVRDLNGTRWLVAEEDLPQIAETLGVPLK